MLSTQIHVTQFDAIDALHAAGDLNPILGQRVAWLTEQGYGLRACDVPGAWWTDIDTLDDLQNQVTVISFSPEELGTE